ncbi:general vesicular transport factor p115-like isoform X2 [Ruditapes philippinarum]|uniref:general vesicular transport factor p115-like isoform X2 n=1 Tax=Ruditapes philippinarum TaxID=129788 RepID=UPI00295A9620|nr:general vesicular transport factor p115-like isoform X2 [Ruditapes philippinarum]
MRYSSKMDYFRKYLGAQPGEGQPSGAETVERLVDRASSSTLLEDRRDAVRAIKALSRKFRLEVGTQAMETLLHVLESDRSDSEITGYALDAFCNVMSNEPTDDEEEVQFQGPDDLGAQFTEIFIKKSDNVGLLLSLLEEYDFHVRWPTVKLITILLTNKCKDLQECILVHPMGVSKLMDLLSDSREIIRNDALLLLNQLTRSNANIQKIVAFENAFERLLDIIHEEGGIDGGIVVEDCLLLLLNLLKNNSSNQNFFREGSHVKYLTPFFDLEQDPHRSQVGWSAQKVTNIHLVLQLVRSLVSPSNPQQLNTNCQKTMYTCGLVQQLCTILMASGVPADVLTETINTVAEVIRGNLQNQEYFASVMAPSNPPRPAIVVLLMSMVNEKQPFTLRCAVLYCFQSFLYKNEVGQSQIVQTLLPTSADVNTISAGQLLCGGLFSTDSLSNWFAAVAMLNAISDNATQKEQLLRVQLATSLGNPPVSLLQQCCNIVAQGGRVQTRLGILMLLATWMADCPTAVSHFLFNTANVPYLISQVSSSDGDENEQNVQGLCAFLLGICLLSNDDQNETFTTASLRQIIEKRIGLEAFTNKLTQVTKSESYTRAIKKPHINYKQASEVVFDYEFCRLFKSVEHDILKALSSNNREESKKQLANLKEHESIVTQYKDLIQEQDERLKDCQGRLESIEGEYRKAKKQLEDYAQQIQQLKDQNALLKATKGSKTSDGDKDEEVRTLNDRVQSLSLQLSEKESHIEKLKTDLSVVEARVVAQEMGEEDKENNPSETAVLQQTVNRLNTDLHELRVELSNKDAEINKLNSECSQLQTQLQQVQSISNTSNEDSDAKVVSLSEDVTKLTDERNTLQDRVKKANEENLNLIDKVHKMEDELSKKDGEKDMIKEELETLKKEQEDLLVLLADQDTKIDKYKQKLKELGQEVEDDDDDDDFDVEDDDDES